MAPRKNKGSKMTPQGVGLQIQRFMRKNAEHKFFESVVSSAIDITWDVFALSQSIVQGITGAQRIGENISYYLLRMVGRITVNPTASFSNVRLVVVLDKMNNGVAPLYNDLFLDNAVDSTYSPAQIKAKRFTIILDESYPLNTQGIGAHMINRSIKLNQTAEFNGATNVVGANGKNSMWCFVVNDNGALKPSINVNFQVEFTDL